MDVYQRRRLVALSILAGVFILIVLLVRSCGGDDEEAPITPLSGTGATGAQALSQADFIGQADGTCLEANTALASVDQSDPAAAATEEGQILAGELEALQTLPAPTEGADDLERFLGALQDQVSAYDRYITALERGDTTAAGELETTIDEAESQVERRARRFGFEVCGDLSQVGEGGGGGGGGGAGDDAEVAPETSETVPAAPVEPAPAEPVAPAPTEPAPAPEGGSATPAPAPAPDGSDSGGVTP